MGEPMRLRPPRHQLDRRTLGWWRTQLALLFGVGVAVAAFLGGAWWPGLYVIAGAVLVVGVAVTLVLPAWWYKVHRWEVTDTAVYTRTGYFWQEWRVAPMSRIQTVDTVRGPLQQLFKLSTVTVTTASAKGEVRIEGLNAGTARDLVEELTRTTQATPGDAT